MNIALIGVPYALDVLKSGKGAAVEALLAAGLAERLAGLGHATQTEIVSIPDTDAERLVRIGQIGAALAGAVARARASGRLPLIFGGDCLVSLGALGGLGDAPNTGIAWLDAHADFNTPETTISGYFGGMPLACAVGRGLAELRSAAGLAPIAEQHVVLINARDLDPLEERALAGSSVVHVPGAGDLRPALPMLQSLGQVYLHIDIDILDPAEAPGVDYPTARGWSLDQLRQATRELAGLGNIAAIAITAVNPEKDLDGRTVMAALSVIEAAAGAL